MVREELLTFILLLKNFQRSFLLLPVTLEITAVTLVLGWQLGAPCGLGKGQTVRAGSKSFSGF